MAYAGYEFANKIIRAVKGEKGIVAPTFVNLAADKEGGEALKKEIGSDLDYFSAPVELGVSLRHSLPFHWLMGLPPSPRVSSPSNPLARLRTGRLLSSRLPFPSSRPTSRRYVHRTPFMRRVSLTIIRIRVFPSSAPPSSEHMWFCNSNHEEKVTEAVLKLYLYM